MWLNSDDMLMPNALNYIAQTYQEKGDGIYFGNCIHFEEKEATGVEAKGSDVLKNFETIPLELVDTIIQPSSFWSKKVWSNNGELNTDFHFGFDWEWFLRAKKNDIPFFKINKPLSMYRFHEAHKTGVGGEKRRDELYKIYSIYTVKYAKLYDLIRNEKFDFKYFQKLYIQFCTILFKSRYSETYFLKKFKKEYNEYSIEEIDCIKWML